MRDDSPLSILRRGGLSIMLTWGQWYQSLCHHLFIFFDNIFVITRLIPRKDLTQDIWHFPIGVEA